MYATDRLSEDYPPAKAYAEIASGLLAVSVSREPRDFVLWFRPEVVETVQWGGDPNKPMEVGPNGIRLTPRKSFEAWTETVRGRSTPWSPSDNDAAFDLRVSLLEVVLRRIDAAARERLRAWQQEQLLMAELDHRVKNTLASIQAMVAQTSRSASSLAAFTHGLDRRIRSMSRAHSLLTQSRWEGVSLDVLIQQELDAYRAEHANVTISGPDVMLLPKQHWHCRWRSMSLPPTPANTGPCRPPAVMSTFAGSLTRTLDWSCAGRKAAVLRSASPHGAVSDRS
ncbi:HWE histidine kinase domain-containing protein [Sphingomonas aerolata]|uniref:HWE histidine kinase domain-containing protein n=1 Tax=Sphingomonas aerolata TaxID=185951 RepID=UPI002FE2E6D3